MPIIRLTFVLVFISSLVLLVAYFMTRNQKYVQYLKQLLKYTGWYFLLMLLLYLVSRVIRL